MDSIHPALTRLTGRPLKTFVTLTCSGSVGPVHTQPVTEAGLTFGPGTRLTVLPKKPFTAPPHLETEQSVNTERLHRLCDE